MKDFQPISCCNVTNKCISKVLVNRIKPALNSFVGTQQSAFVPGRHIDNILLMQELTSGYHREGGVARCALKLDIQKAYDSVDRSFLKVVLVAMEFPGGMIELIMTYVSTPTYSVVALNGYFEGYFSGARGLRQGDHMSPYLFILVIEAFSHMLHTYTRHNEFTFHPKCEPLGISHLIFVDDLFIMSSADPMSLRYIKNAIDEFGVLSGLKPNFQKSSMFLVGISEDRKAELSQLMGMDIKELLIRYLGVPLISTRLHSRDCSAIKDRILKRVNS